MLTILATIHIKTKEDLLMLSTYAYNLLLITCRHAIFVTIIKH